jgi:acyl dehydratase
MNTNQLHFNEVAGAASRFGRQLVNSTLTLALVTGLTVTDTSESTGINLEWGDIRLPSPVFVGDTIWTETEILELRDSRSNPEVGIVEMRSRGINQRREVVCEYRRTFMLPKRGTAAAKDIFPETNIDWSV